MVKIVCWNINRSADACSELRKMDADIALLQEVGKGASQRMADILGEAETWDWDWPAVVRLSDRVKVDVFKPVAPDSGGITRNTIAVGDPRTLAGARVAPVRGSTRAGRSFVVFSLYARWLDTHPEAYHSTTRKGGRSFGIYSDGSAHRAISDLSAFIGHTNPSAHRMLVAGDLNTIYGATDNNRLEKPARRQSGLAEVEDDVAQQVGHDLSGHHCRR